MKVVKIFIQQIIVRKWFLFKILIRVKDKQMEHSFLYTHENSHLEILLVFFVVGLNHTYLLVFLIIIEAEEGRYFTEVSVVSIFK